MSTKHPGTHTATTYTATVPAGSAVSLTTGTPANVVSLTLPPGNYIAWGVLDLVLSAVTATAVEGGVSVTSNTLPTQPGGGGLGTDALIINILSVTLFSGTTIVPTPQVLLVLTATTTIYLVAETSFTAGSVSAYGTLNAVRL